MFTVYHGFMNYLFLLAVFKDNVASFPSMLSVYRVAETLYIRKFEFKPPA